MASSLLQKLAQEDAERVTLLSIEKAELDQRNLIHQAYKEGYQEEYQKGKLEGSEERAKKMVRALAKQGVDLSIISVAAELPVERVKELLDDE